MDFQALVNASGMAAAVLSVEKTNDFRDYGDIRIVCANESYKKIMGPAYRDNMIYSELLPKEPNFEDFCYRCAVKKLHLHAYVDTKSMGLWTDGTYIPLSKRDDVIVKNEHDMAELEKVNPVWVKSLRAAGVKSLVLVPLSQGKKLLGVLFITNFDIEKIVELKQYIELTAFFLSSEIANNDLMEKLEFMSNVDLLTDVKNRNSMNARVDLHVSGEKEIKTPYGVVFADLNGLKQCNDSVGHEAGDKLLKSAADFLKKHFGDDEIYRSGGDEFVVIVPGCKKDDLRRCMHNADEAMYADKNKFYKEYPDLARK